MSSARSCAVRTGAARAPGFLRLWLTGSAAVAAVCGGQALLAGALGDGSALGGGSVKLLAFCMIAGALLALALRIARTAEELVRSLRPAAPRLRIAAALVRRSESPRANRPTARLALVTRERGPPTPLG